MDSEKESPLKTLRLIKGTVNYKQNQINESFAHNLTLDDLKSIILKQYCKDKHLRAIELVEFGFVTVRNNIETIYSPQTKLVEIELLLSKEVLILKQISCEVPVHLGYLCTKFLLHQNTTVGDLKNQVCQQYDLNARQFIVEFYQLEHGLKSPYISSELKPLYDERKELISNKDGFKTSQHGLVIIKKYFDTDDLAFDTNFMKLEINFVALRHIFVNDLCFLKDFPNYFIANIIEHSYNVAIVFDGCKEFLPAQHVPESLLKYTSKLLKNRLSWTSQKSSNNVEQAYDSMRSYAEIFGMIQPIFEKTSFPTISDAENIPIYNDLLNIKKSSGYLIEFSSRFFQFGELDKARSIDSKPTMFRTDNKNVHIYVYRKKSQLKIECSNIFGNEHNINSLHLFSNYVDEIEHALDYYKTSHRAEARDASGKATLKKSAENKNKSDAAQKGFKREINKGLKHGDDNFKTRVVYFNELGEISVLENDYSKILTILFPQRMYQCLEKVDIIKNSLTQFNLDINIDIRDDIFRKHSELVEKFNDNIKCDFTGKSQDGSIEFTSTELVKCDYELTTAFRLLSDHLIPFAVCIAIEDQTPDKNSILAQLVEVLGVMEGVLDSAYNHSRANNSKEMLKFAGDLIFRLELTEVSIESIEQLVDVVFAALNSYADFILVAIDKGCFKSNFSGAAHQMLTTNILQLHNIFKELKENALASLKLDEEQEKLFVTSEQYFTLILNIISVFLGDFASVKKTDALLILLRELGCCLELLQQYVAGTDLAGKHGELVLGFNSFYKQIECSTTIALSQIILDDVEILKAIKDKGAKINRDANDDKKVTQVLQNILDSFSSCINLDCSSIVSSKMYYKAEAQIKK